MSPRDAKRILGCLAVVGYFMGIIALPLSVSGTVLRILKSSSTEITGEWSEWLIFMAWWWVYESWNLHGLRGEWLIYILHGMMMSYVSSFLSIEQWRDMSHPVEEHAVTLWLFEVANWNFSRFNREITKFIIYNVPSVALKKKTIHSPVKLLEGKSHSFTREQLQGTFFSTHISRIHFPFFPPGIALGYQQFI